jgi:hypothetical protein
MVLLLYVADKVKNRNVSIFAVFRNRDGYGE